MKYKVLVVDDSKLARKQLISRLPSEFNAEFVQAENGAAALQLIEGQHFDLMFLDLTMPILDGYGTLERLQRMRKKITTIVVSGDIQADAKKRVASLGARAFLKKPAHPEVLMSAVRGLGFKLTNGESHATVADKIVADPIDRIREVANVALGQAAAILAERANVFVQLPIPNVAVMESAELKMALYHLAESDNAVGVTQRFVGAGIRGEALLTIHNADIEQLRTLMRLPALDVDQDREVMMETANILIGICLKTIEDQLQIHFAMSQPTLLNDAKDELQAMASDSERVWSDTLTIEYAYNLESTSIRCELLLLIDDRSIEKLNKRTEGLA